MDAPSITDLPASAQRVLAGHLRPSDAGNCRLASSLLSGVAPDRLSTRLWVIASTFRRQVEDDAYHSGRSSGFVQQLGDGSCSQNGETHGSVPYGDLCTASSLARAAQGVVRAEVLVDASESCDAAVWQALFSSLLSSNSLSELTITEYCSQHSSEVVDAIASRQIASCSALSWSMARQQHRGPQDTLNSSGTSRTPAPPRHTTLPLTAADSAWLPALVAAAASRAGQLLPGAGLQTRPAAAPDQQQQQQQQNVSASVPTQQQQQSGEDVQGQQVGGVPLSLRLQLLGPLHPQHQMQLLQLQGLASLSVVKTPAWLTPRPKAAAAAEPPLQQQLPAAAAGGDVQAWLDSPLRATFELGQLHPVLPTPALRELTGLSHLSSLDCTVGPPMMYKEKAAEVGTTLQQLLLDLGSRLTQLTIGPQHPERTHYSLAAPLRMPALRSLTCGLGFSLDVETDTYDLAMQQIQLVSQQPTPAPAAAAGAAHNGSSTEDPASDSSEQAPVVARAPAGPAALLPSLTRLVLIDRACVPDVLQHLADSEAACSQLQHLQIPQLSFEDEDDGPDYNAFNDQQQQRRQDPGVSSLQHLGRLRGLQELQAELCGRQQVDALVAGVGSQLQGLTVTCHRSNPLYLPLGMASSACQVQLQSLLKGMPQLTSLKVVGSTGAVLDPHQDLPVAAQHLTALRSLSYTGRIFALPSRGFELLPGMLPATLQGLTIVSRQSASLAFDADGLYTLHPGCFPQGLTSLKCRGFSWQRPGEVEPWCPWFGWEYMPRGLRQLELEAEAPCVGTGPGSILPVSSPAAVTGVTAQELSGKVSASAAEAATAAAAACGSTFEAPPSLVQLPALESLALHMHANRHAADMEEPDRLPLAALLDHLSALTILTNLHISSQAKYSPSDWCSGLSGLVSLKVLTLDVALPDPGNSYTGRQLLPDPLNTEAFETLVQDLSTHLAPSCGLRLLRLPLLSCAPRGTVRLLEQQLPNCLLAEADDTFLEGSSMVD